MDKKELIARLRAQRTVSQKESAAEKKKKTGMSHEEQLDYQVKVWADADRKENHALRHLRSLARSANVDALGKDADDGQLIAAIPDEAWERICAKYEAYLLEGIEILRPFAKQLDEAAKAKAEPVKKSTPSRAELLLAQMKEAVINKDTKRQKEIMSEMAMDTE